MKNILSEHDDYLFERVIYQLVQDCIDYDELRDLQEKLFIELARRPGVDDQQLLAITRALIARAFRAIALAEESGTVVDEQDLRHRYLNAICREVDPTVPVS